MVDCHRVIALECLFCFFAFFFSFWIESLSTWTSVVWNDSFPRHFPSSFPPLLSYLILKNWLWALLKTYTNLSDDDYSSVGPFWLTCYTHDSPCLSVYPHLCLSHSVCPSICLSACPSVCPSICWSISDLTLSRIYLLSCWTFCNQTWYASASPWGGALCEKGCCLQGQGHSEVLCNENMAVFTKTVSLELMILLQSNIDWW